MTPLSDQRSSLLNPELNPEKVAYWYLRLNGFFQIENFYVHPSSHGGARTDADLLAVRFPHRAERLYDDRDDIMKDDYEGLSLSPDRIDVVIAEVKTSRCGLNGPWTNPDGQNIHRVLASIGCLPHGRINEAALAIYEKGFYEDEALLRIRLMAIGREADEAVRQKYTEVSQVIWSHLLAFMFDRFWTYRYQKTQTDHWENTGRKLKQKATESDMARETFVEWAISAMKARGRRQ